MDVSTQGISATVLDTDTKEAKVGLGKDSRPQHHSNQYYEGWKTVDRV